MFSLELPEGLKQMRQNKEAGDQLESLRSLRNIFIPPKCKLEEGYDFKDQEKSDLRLDFPSSSSSSRTIWKALKHRFDRLPIHKM